MNFLLLFFIYFRFFNFSTYFIFLATIIYGGKKLRNHVEVKCMTMRNWEMHYVSYALRWRVVLVMLILNALTVLTKQNCISFSVVKDFKNKNWINFTGTCFISVKNSMNRDICCWYKLAIDSFVCSSTTTLFCQRFLLK